jgi:hypothetical protein
MLHSGHNTIFLTLTLYQKKMKRKLTYIAALFLIASSFTSCDMLGDGCQVCQTVSYDNGNIIAVGVESEYCDQELLTIKAIPPTTFNGVTTQWECR